MLKLVIPALLQKLLVDARKDQVDVGIWEIFEFKFLLKNTFGEVCINFIAEVPANINDVVDVTRTTLALI